MKWFSWVRRKENRFRPRRKRQFQQLSTFRPPTYDHPFREERRSTEHVWSEKQWSQNRRFSKKLPWFSLSVSAHLLLLAWIATLMFPSSAKRQALPVPVQVLPPETFSPAASIPDHLASPPEPKQPPSSPVAEDIGKLQSFRADWTARADRLERRLVELATAAATQEHTIERQQRQQTEVQQEAERLASELAEKTTEQQQLASRLAEEQTRRAQLEAEIAAQREQREAELRTAQEAYARLIADLQTEITRKDIAIHEFTDQLSITIVDRVLFPSGQETLTAEGKQILEKVGRALAKRTDQRIQIEGHTDDQDIGLELKKRFASNWELSTARATEVVRYLLGHTSLPANRLLAVGRADTMPVASNATETGRQQNRRIEIILLPPDKLKQTAQDAQGHPG